MKYYCDECKYFYTEEDEWGDCHLKPPKVMLNHEGEYYSKRPAVFSDDIACSKFKRDEEDTKHG